MSSGDDKTSTASQLDLSTLQSLYVLNSEWIRSADTKAGLQLTASGLVLGLLTDGLTSEDSVLFGLTGLVLGLVILSYALLVVATILSLLALGPRLRGVGSGSSLIYFGDSAKLGRETYLSRMQQATNADMGKDFLDQIHELSVVAQRKHVSVQVGTTMILGAVCSGAIAWVVAGLGG